MSILSNTPHFSVQQPVEELQLSLKALGSLKRSQIFTLADLLDYTQEDLLILDPEVGEEVIAVLQTKMGITLPVK
jgi:DNA-directed RNA polymerase alpha subunit